jgi:hypothetical protein
MTTLLSTAPPSVAQRTFTTEDRWVTALDGRLVSVGEDAYPLIIVGIHRGTDGDVWIQLAPFDHDDRHRLRADRGVTLHCHAAESPVDVLRALRAHLVAHGVKQGGCVEVPRR